MKSKFPDKEVISIDDTIILRKAFRIGIGIKTEEQHIVALRWFDLAIKAVGTVPLKVLIKNLQLKLQLGI